MKLINQLEPNSLIDNFLKHPPINFNSEISQDDVPVFFAKFDLLTTVDTALQQKFKRAPLYKWWSKFLQPMVTFVGTTVSEYVLLNKAVDTATLAAHLKQDYANRFPFIIVKDIPEASPLLSEEANSYSRELIDSLHHHGFIEVAGQALAWVPVDYTSIDDYLSRLSASRRKDFRRKLKNYDQLDIQQLNSGDACFFDKTILDHYYQLYLNVYEQSEIHFDLLSADFFKQLLQDGHTNTKIFTYSHQGQLIGYNICFVIDNMLIDKYLGCIYPQARNLNLYFISWFYNLEYARQAGLNSYIAGWTDPQVKASLGAKFTLTKHMVYIRNPLLRCVLKRMSGMFESDHQWHEQHNNRKNNG